VAVRHARMDEEEEDGIADSVTLRNTGSRV